MKKDTDQKGIKKEARTHLARSRQYVLPVRFQPLAGDNLRKTREEQRRFQNIKMKQRRKKKRKEDRRSKRREEGEKKTRQEKKRREDRKKKERR